MFIASAVIILGAGSCQKDTTMPPQIPPPRQPFSLDLVAGHWVKTCDPRYTHYGECSNDHTMYTANLQGVLSTSNLNCACKIKVYLVVNGKEIQINGTPILFMGSLLYATVNRGNVELTYESTAYSLPFSFLAIKVVGE
jgi:hypothetical protein